MRRAGGHLIAASSWLLVLGLAVVPATLGRLDAQRDLWAHVCICLIAGLAAAGLLLGGAPWPRMRRRDLSLAALFLAFLIAALGTVYRRATLEELMRLLDYLVLYWLVRALLRKREMFLAGVAAFAAGTALCAVLGLQEYLVTAAIGDRSWRAFGPFYNPNLLAAALLMAIPLWIGLLKLARLPAVWLLCGLALALCWLGLFVTGSKGGLLALLGALLVGAVIAADPARGGLAKRALGGVGLVALAAAAAMLLPPIRLRLGDAFGPQSNSMMFRYYTWLGTWHMVLARPVLGFGPGTFAAAYPRFAIVGHTMLAHETYLQVAAETGLLGGFCLLGALGAQLTSGFQAARRLIGEYRTVSAAATAGMVGFCLHNVVDYAWHVTATGMAFWVLAGFVGAALDEAGEPGTASGRSPGDKPGRQEASPLSRRTILSVTVAVAVALVAGVPAVLALQAERLARGRDLRAAVRLDPLNDAYRRQLAAIAQEGAAAGRPWLYEEALWEWDRVEELRPTYPGTHYHRGWVYEAQGKPSQALGEYRRAVAAAPTWTKALVAQATLLEDLGQDEQALAVYGRLDALADSPLLKYRAVVDDLDPNFARAWLAIGDRQPATEARDRYVRAARYLRQVFAANRRMEGAWRLGGEWQHRQGEDLIELAEEGARRHLSFEDPGPRLRAALLLTDAGRLSLGERLFVVPGDAVAGEAFFGEILQGWASYVSSCHLGATGSHEAAERLLPTAGQRIAGALSQQNAVRVLPAGPYGFTSEELAELEAVVQEAEKVQASSGSRSGRSE